MKKATFFDFDKTIFTTYAIFPFVDFLEKEKFINQKQKDEYYLILRQYKNKKIKYELAVKLLLKKMASHIKSQKVSLINSLTKKFAQKNKNLFFPFTTKLINYLRKKGFKIIVVSGEPEFIIKEILQQNLKIKKIIASKYETRNNKYTGKIIKHLDYREKKENEIKKLAKSQNIDLDKSLAFGDSEGDIAMLKLVGKPFVINPTKKLIQLAKSRNWTIVDKSNIFKKVKKKIKW